MSAPKTGQCRRFPPTPVVLGAEVKGYFPIAFHDSWCGEHATLTVEDDGAGED